jgi:hypothetical protein
MIRRLFRRSNPRVEGAIRGEFYHSPRDGEVVARAVIKTVTPVRVRRGR